MLSNSNSTSPPTNAEEREKATPRCILSTVDRAGDRS